MRLMVFCINCKKVVWSGVLMSIEIFESSSLINNICYCDYCDSRIVWNKNHVTLEEE